MARKLTSASLLTLLLLAFAGTALAQDEASPAEPEKSWAFSGGLDRASRYLFRGSDLLDGEAVVVPNLRYGFGDFAVYYYGYFGNLPHSHKYREADFGAEYAIGLGDKATFTLGAVTYQYNKDAENDLVFLDTYEFYGILALDLPLAPTISYYRDVDKVKGGYASISLAHSVPLGAKASLDLSGAVGFDFGYNNKAKGDGTLNDALFGVNVPFHVNDHFSVHGQVQRSIALDSLDARRRADPSLTGTSEDETIVTFGGAFSF